MQLAVSFPNEKPLQIVGSDVIVDEIFETFGIRLQKFLDDEESLSPVFAEASKEGGGVAWRIRTRTYAEELFLSRLRMRGGRTYLQYIQYVRNSVKI